ncbi:hypothetical protein RBH85_37080 (plasmid) [Streptomyces rochei]|nr:hypothetical protein [Streptomyces rochei]WMI62076.1 hypothetical protein RBH85_37080 [Streptomyces rochei]
MTTNRARKQATRTRARQEEIPYSEARRREEAGERPDNSAALADLARCEAGIIRAKEAHDREMLEAATQFAEAYGLDETHMTYFRLAVRYLIKADEPYNAGAPIHRMTREHIEESMARVRCAAPAVLATIRPLVEYVAESHNGKAWD